jgi:serine/threonine-protein kinase Chk2
MVHRDLKPENILLMDEDFTVKIGDFGLAKIVGEASFTTTLCGTPSYVAPEILAESRNRKYTKAVDIWSLGVVLYICLCGFPPFSDELKTADFPYSLADQIRKGIFDYPSPYWDSVGDPARKQSDKSPLSVALLTDNQQLISLTACSSWTRKGATRSTSAWPTPG